MAGPHPSDGGPAGRPVDHLDADLIALGIWGRTPKQHRRYGGALFDGSANYFSLMHPAPGTGPDEAVLRAKGETASVRWVRPDEAPRLIALTPNTRGRLGDLAVLDAAVEAHRRLGAA